MPTVAELTTKEAPSWCSGCGDFVILSTIKSAFVELNLPQHQTLVVSGIGCLPPEEKVSVGDKWIPIEDLQSNDVVINGDGHYTNIKFKTINQFDGEMLEIVPYVSTFNSIRLTPEHPVLCVRRLQIRSRNQISKKKAESVTPDYVEAGKLKKGDYLVFSWNKEVKDNVTYTKEFCRLLGYYLAEGYIGEGGGRNRDSANISFSFNSDEKEFIGDVVNLSLKLIGRRPYIRDRKEIGKVAEVVICSKKLALLFKKLAGKGAGNKKLTEEIMILPPEKQKEILEGYIRGDGHSFIAKGGKHTRYHANTLSENLAIQIQEIAARLGIFASIYKKKTKPHSYKGRIIQPSGDQYAIAFQPLKAFDFVQKTRFGFLVPIGEINKKPYSGIVHNFQTTTEPHSYLARGFVVHNCGSKTPHFIKTYGFEGLHGRALPVATAAKLINPELNVVVVSGDGDCYGIGGNHLIHAMRRNINLTLIVQNNEVYGLTKGQYSPTSEKGFKSPSTPNGGLEAPVNPMKLALAMGATYVARGYAFDIVHLKKLIVDAMKHKGFAIIDVFQPCSTYNKVNTMVWYKQRLYKLEESGHDPSNINEAFARAAEWGDKIPIGLFYETQKPCYEDGMPQLATPPVKHDISNINMETMLARLR